MTIGLSWLFLGTMFHDFRSWEIIATSLGYQWIWFLGEILMWSYIYPMDSVASSLSK